VVTIMNERWIATATGVVPAELEARILAQPSSRFTADLVRYQRELSDAVRAKRVLVVGGGGSIGSSTVALIADLAPACLHVVDLSENYLAELVRDLRGRPQGLSVADFRTLPLDYGGPIMRRFLAEAAGYQLVLNFAALKHVRSEKDPFSLLQMLDINVVRHVRFKQWLAQYGHAQRYFAVSTDKAANPTSLMGASKRLMEDVVFDVALPASGVATSARFANVAFSNGSLLQGFLTRLAKQQPLAVPRDTRRYFVSLREAGEICLLSSLIAPAQHVMYPKLDQEAALMPLEQVAVAVLDWAGYQPQYFEDEASARQAVGDASASKRWPLLLTPLDTSGEKPFEEFVADGETSVEVGFDTLAAVRHAPGRAVELGLYDRLAGYLEATDRTVTKAEIVALIAEGVPGLQHRETGRSLDERL
jgi:FlaA1/EpsC-like NDP-sugar epimerase